MPRRNEAHEAVIESLTEALLQMMEQKPLAEINITELCGHAGVSRISFYRNFESVEDILVQKLTACTDLWWQEFSQRKDEDFLSSFWDELLDQYRKNSRLILLLSQNNATGILKQHIFSCCNPALEKSDEAGYLRAVLAGAIYGLVDEWVRRGMKELPEGFGVQTLRSVYMTLGED